MAEFFVHIVWHYNNYHTISSPPPKKKPKQITQIKSLPTMIMRTSTGICWVHDWLSLACVRGEGREREFRVSFILCTYSLEESVFSGLWFMEKWWVCSKKLHFLVFDLYPFKIMFYSLSIVQIYIEFILV